jgi:hypothetical protein
MCSEEKKLQNEGNINIMKRKKKSKLGNPSKRKPNE